MSGSNPTPHGYKAQWGYYTDVESGILFLTHRYLDPATGRFLTRDPIGVEGGVNLYQYVGNRVVVRADPPRNLCYRSLSLRGVCRLPSRFCTPLCWLRAEPILLEAMLE